MQGKQSDWNPNLYLRFGTERIQPTVDLVNRIPLSTPDRIVDIGCGPGNSTEVLACRWPDAHITGIDSSEAMIQAAGKRLPNVEWRVADAQELGANEMFDLVFSNAVIQWIPDHEKLIPALFRMVKPGGVLAIQVPLSSEMPIALAIEKCYERLRLKNDFSIGAFLQYNPVETYMDILSLLSGKFDVWVTSYYHVMESSLGIYEMMKSTRIRPYLDSIEDEAKSKAFEESLKKEIADVYKPLKNGKVIFPFKRLFMMILKEQ